MKITAAVVNEKGGRFDLQKMELDDPKNNEVLVKIKATGTCHTDMAARDGIMGIPPLPVVLGHEGAGIVEKVGPGVDKVKPGDHVVLTFGFCGKCLNCKKGLPAYCYHFMELNFAGCRMDGSHSHHQSGADIHDNFFSQSSFGTYAIAHENNVVKIPDDVPLEIMGPLGCGIQTGAGAVINSLKAGPGSGIAISGIGAVGLAALMAAHASGCFPIIAIDINASRLDTAKQLGATHTINSKEQDVEKAVRKIVAQGLDFVFDTTGRSDVINSGLNSLKPHGICGIVGIGSKPLEIDMNSFVARGIQLKGIVEGDSVPDSFIPLLIDLYRSGRFPFDKLIKTYAFEDINRAIADSEEGHTIKPVILIGDYVEKS